MGTFNSVVLFVLIWWVVLFAVLPFGVRPVEGTDNPAGWRGAPERPMMWRKLLATTLVSLALWGAALAVIYAGWLSFRPPADGLGA